MSDMFYNCTISTSIDLTTFRIVFYNYNSVGSLDVSYFNTSQVEDFSDKFNGCQKVGKLNVPIFDTSESYIYELYVSLMLKCINIR